MWTEKQFLVRGAWFLVRRRFCWGFSLWSNRRLNRRLHNRINDRGDNRFHNGRHNWRHNRRLNRLLRLWRYHELTTHKPVMFPGIFRFISHHKPFLKTKNQEQSTKNPVLFVTPTLTTWNN